MFGSNCYKYPGGDTANWADAESQCEGLLAGAHLASIHSAEEMQFVRDNAPTDASIQLGGSDLNEEGVGAALACSIVSESFCPNLCRSKSSMTILSLSL